MKPQTLKIKLGNLTLSLTVGDVDKDGAADLSFGVRLVGFVTFDFPPVNLDAKFAADAVAAFQDMGKALAKKRA